MAVTASAGGGATWPSVPALPDPATETVLASGLLDELSYALGGPFHFLLPDAFDANLRAMQAALKAADVDGFVYFAKKSNKAAVWVERCAAHGAGVDVASSASCARHWATAYAARMSSSPVLPRGANCSNSRCGRAR